MYLRFLISFIMVFVFCTAVCSAAEQKDLIGYYRYFNESKIDEGFVIKHLVEVDVFKINNIYYVDWLATINPPGRTIGSVSPARIDDQGQLVFSFDDGWENKGHGAFYRLQDDYAIRLDVDDKDSELWPMVGNLYGTTSHLIKLNELPNKHRHPWSLGR